MAELVAFTVDYRRNGGLKLMAMLRQDAARITADHVGDLTNRMLRLSHISGVPIQNVLLSYL